MNTHLKLLQAISNLKTKTDNNSKEINTIKNDNAKNINDIDLKIKKNEEQYFELNKKNKEIINKIKNIKLKEPKNGIDGKDGKDGYTPIKGIDYFDGENGRDGYTPIKGVDYFDGKDGKDGIGIKGENGKDGVSIIDVKIDKNGHLIIYFSNGKKKDIGLIKGKDGIGYPGVGIIDVKIENGHLIITLSTGKKIDAGVVSGGPGGEEIDPIFTASAAHSITDNDISNWNNKSDFSGDYNDLTNKPVIPVVPSNISAFNNDVGYLTEHQDISGKYDKTGGEISGNVKVDGTFTLDIEDEDYDAGIRFDKSLNNNLGTILTLTGYADNTNYKPIIRNIGTPSQNYDVANKKYVDDNLIVPNYYLTLLNADGTVDTTTSTLNYNTVLSNLTNRSRADYLDLVWGTTRFYAKCIEVTDVNTGDLKFIGEIEYQGIQRYIVFTLNSSNVLTTTNIITFESVSNKVQSVVSNSTSIEKYPSTKAVYDEFQRKPVVIWESNTPSEYLKAITADISANPNWQLTDLDMTTFKRIKIYSCAGQKTGTTASASTTPAIILEMSLDERNAISAYGGNYVGSIMVQKPNDANRLATLTCAVSADKTKFVVLRQTNLYGTAATNNNDVNANVFMIEGYYD